jgi:hypothetical protein
MGIFGRRRAQVQEKEDKANVLQAAMGVDLKSYESCHSLGSAASVRLSSADSAEAQRLVAVLSGRCNDYEVQNQRLVAMVERLKEEVAELTRSYSEEVSAGRRPAPGEVPAARAWKPPG